MKHLTLSKSLPLAGLLIRAAGALRLYNISLKNNSPIMTKNKTVKQKKASAFTQSKLFLSFEDVRDDDKTIS